MEIQFENRYYADDSMIKEYVNKVIYHRTKWTGAFICVLSLVMFAVSYREGNSFFMAVYAVCFLILLGALLLLSPLAIKQIKENEKKLHNGQSCETVVRFGDSITMEEGKCVFTIEYSQIERIYYLKHSCVLMFGKRNGILLSPAGFTKGSFVEFQDFIEHKTANCSKNIK